MAQNFKNRSFIIDPMPLMLNSSQHPAFLKELMKKNQSLVGDELILHYFKHFVYQNFAALKSSYTEDIDWHIAESGAGNKPYFVMILTNTNITVVKKFNFV